MISGAMFKDAVRHGEDRSLGEHYFITTALAKDFEALERRGTEIEGALDAIFQPYRILAGDQAVLVLYKDARLVYTNQEPIMLDKSFVEAPDDGNRLLSLHKTDGRSNVIVSGRLPAPYQYYTLVYVYDMTDTVAAWTRTKNMLFLIGFFLSCLLAVGLLFLLNRLFKPLTQISHISREIAAGAYETRLPDNGKDELSEMARSFNNMAEEIQRQMTELKVVADRKQQFVDNFAHELHTPLTAIYGYAEYLQKAALTEDDRLTALDYIMSESRRLQALANQLLFLANLKHEAIAWEPQNVSDLFKYVKQTLHKRAIEQKVELHFQSKVKAIQGDAHLLKSLMINLVDNAIKACETGGEVTMLAHIEEGKKTIIIQDNGKGMPPEIHKRVTEPFYRAEKSRNRRDGGTGLGLAISKQIAKHHHAKLEFVSQPSEGTTVKIIFTKS